MQRPGCRSLFNHSLCFAAMSALVLGFCSGARAGKKNPSLARVEKVKDTDGSTWEVLDRAAIPVPRRWEK